MHILCRMFLSFQIDFFYKIEQNKIHKISIINHKQKIFKMKIYSPSDNFKLDKVLFGSRILGKNV